MASLLDDNVGLDGNRAKVKVALLVENDADINCDMVMVYENSRWLVDDLDFREK